MKATGPPDPASQAAVLEIGQRLSEAPSGRLTSTAFCRELNAQLGLSPAMSWVDLAHTLTLAEEGVIPPDAARPLIAALLDLQQNPASFAPSSNYGDLYTNREAWLAKHTSAAGWLGAARARREALTTAYHLVLCDELLGLGESLASVAQALNTLSLRHRTTLTPDYTYLQQAQPTTFGHYFQSFAWPALRDLDRIEALYSRANQCPAGIGSSNGTVTMQNRRKLAERLGFSQPVRHARDAMWQADIALESCAVALAAVINLDRLAEDLMILASSEFGFVKLADRHARASKIMPQKRNPFALAFIRATANRLLGVLAGIAAASRTPSGQMDNRLFAYEAVPDALRSAAEAASLAAECIAGLSIDEARSQAAMASRSACASDLAERLMAAAGIDYRAAHKAAGGLARSLEEKGRCLADVSASEVSEALKSAGLPAKGITEDLVAAALDPALCVSARKDTGCAAPGEVAAMASELNALVSERRSRFESRRMRREEALRSLLAEAKTFAEARP
ncbi:MAG TPA: lyase family protein [Methylocella sp.]|nr:lyase family protein [Methylocella sp.]